MGHVFINSPFLDSWIVIVRTIVVRFNWIIIHYYCNDYRYIFFETVELTVKIVIEIIEIDEIDMFNYEI